MERKTPKWFVISTFIIFILLILEDIPPFNKFFSLPLIIGWIYLAVSFIAMITFKIKKIEYIGLVLALLSFLSFTIIFIMSSFALYNNILIAYLIASPLPFATLIISGYLLYKDIIKVDK